MLMARSRKKHVQQELPKLRKPDKNGQWRGGKREGAGRPKKGKGASEAHQPRPVLSGREPLLITTRVSNTVGNLRRDKSYRAIRKALAVVIERHDFRVCHFSIQQNHLHMLVEADHKLALARGMQAFLISAARHLNAELERDGTVFVDRYNQRVITSPKQCRNAMSYVLNNWRRHDQDLFGKPRTWLLDPYSSAINFDGWRELGARRKFDAPQDYERPTTREPRTWLLRVGWERHGLISVREVPGPQGAIGMAGRAFIDGVR